MLKSSDGLLYLFRSVGCGRLRLRCCKEELIRAGAGMLVVGDGEYGEW